MIIRANILILSAWLRQLDWDTSFPFSDARHWQQFFAELLRLEQLLIKRWLDTDIATISKSDTDIDNSQIEIHDFANASERSYAAVVYLRVTRYDKITTHLLTAKNKVVPVKQISLPRLELSAVTLLTSLASATN